MPRTPKVNRAVKFSVSVSERHVRLLDLLDSQKGWNRSRSVQEALDRLMRDPSLFSPLDLHSSTDKAHNSASEAAS